MSSVSSVLKKQEEVGSKPTKKDGGCWEAEKVAPVACFLGEGRGGGGCILNIGRGLRRLELNGQEEEGFQASEGCGMFVDLPFPRHPLPAQAS